LQNNINIAAGIRFYAQIEINFAKRKIRKVWMEKIVKPNAENFLANTRPHLTQLQVALEQRLKLDSNQPALWFRLADVCRGLGDYGAAARCYEQALAGDYEPELSSYLLQLMRPGVDLHALEYPYTDYLPVPFIQADNLLSTCELAAVWRFFDDNSEGLVESGVGALDNQRVNHDVRKSRLLQGSLMKPIRSMFTRRLMPVLEQAYRQFGIVPPENQSVVLQMTSHVDGEFYGVHTDSGEQRF